MTKLNPIGTPAAMASWWIPSPQISARADGSGWLPSAEPQSRIALDMRYCQQAAGEYHFRIDHRQDVVGPHHLIRVCQSSLG